MDSNSGIVFYRTIGVAVGKGTSSMQALKWVLDNENLRQGGTLHLLHVYPPGPVRSEYADPAAMRKFQEKRNKNAENLISRYIKVCDENEVKTEVHYGESDAVPEALVQLIRSIRITRIVIGPSKTNLLAKLTRKGGRIASYVSKHTEQDCEVVRLRRSRKGIVVAVRSIASERKTSDEDIYTAYTTALTLLMSRRFGIPDTLPRSRSVGKDTPTLTGYDGVPFSAAPATCAPYLKSTPNNPAASPSQTTITGNDQELTEIFLHIPSDLDMKTVTIAPAVGTSESKNKSTQKKTGGCPTQSHQKSKSGWTPPTEGTNSTGNSREFINSWRETAMNLEFMTMVMPPPAGTIEMNGTWNNGQLIHSPDETQNHQDSTYLWSTTASSTSDYVPSTPETSASDSTWNGRDMSELIDCANLVGDQDSLVHEIQATQNQIDQAALEAGYEVEVANHADKFVEDAERIIVESERQRRDALKEAEAAKLQWLETARKCQELSQENETLRKDCQSKVDALTTVIEGYTRDVASAGTQVKDGRRKCKKLQKRIEELISELEKEIGKRKEAEQRATKECAMKEEALADLRKAQKKYTECSFRELEIATNNFDEGNKLGEGGYGPVFKGKLLHTPVAVKVLTREGVHGWEEFQREVELLNNLHHPHLVMLMGACPERACIVYEYMSNGSLEDRLACKGGTPALPWFVRFRICAEIATALLFLHSQPVPIVHRDMKPGNILLDQNYVSKIGDVGIAKLVSSQELLDITAYDQEGSMLKGTMAYMDPDYQRTGIVTCKSDVYALGIVMLRLLTGSRAFGVAAMVEDALERQQLHRVLDRKAGEWPLNEASCLARISLQCAEPKTRDRPDLEMEVLPILERLRAYADQTASAMVSASSSSRTTLSDSHSFNTNPSFSSHSMAIVTNTPFQRRCKRSS